MRSRVIQLARLGDLLQSLPLCRALRREGPLELVLAFDPGRRLRAEADKVTVVEPWSLARAARHPALFLHRLTDALGGEDALADPVDLQICLNDDPAATGLARLLPALRVAGAGQPGDPYARWLRLVAEHRRENQLLLAEAMLACLPATPSPAPPTREAGPGDVVLHPGSGNPARRLPEEFWVELGRGLLDLLPDRRIVLTGGLLELDAVSAVERGLGRPDRVLNTCGRLELDELADLLDETAMVVAQDTGVLHLAAWLGRPLLGLYHGSAWPRETAPWLDGAHVLLAQEDCAPCVEGRPTCEDWHCRQRFDARRVAACAARVLDGGVLEPGPGLVHLVCRADAGGVFLEEAGVPDPVSRRERDRQLALVRKLGTAGPRDQRLAESLEWARGRGMSAAGWRAREWTAEPADWAECWHWHAHGQPEEA